MEFDWGPYIQLMLEVAIDVLVPLVLSALFGLAIKGYAYVRANTDSKKFDFAVGVVRQLVMAAEMNGLSGALSNLGEEKKKYVFALAEAELKRRGITLDIDVLDALIEAQVKEAIKDVEVPAI